MNTSRAEATYYRKIKPRTFEQKWRQRQHAPSENESEIADQMVVNETGQEQADQAFDQHHREIRGCPGGARDGNTEDERFESIGSTKPGVLPLNEVISAAP